MSEMTQIGRDGALGMSCPWRWCLTAYAPFPKPPRLLALPPNGTATGDRRAVTRQQPDGCQPRQGSGAARSSQPTYRLAAGMSPWKVYGAARPCSAGRKPTAPGSVALEELHGALRSTVARALAVPGCAGQPGTASSRQPFGG